MAGGLAVALSEMLTQHSGIWMGWNGKIDTSNSHNITRDDPSFSIIKKNICASTELLANPPSPCITYLTTALTSDQYQHYYCGFANNVLWPMLHEQPSFIEQSSEDYHYYQHVNKLFAHQLKKIIEPEDVIWVHDYHFLSVAYHCRQLGITNRIGFFLHIPFAPLKFWQQLNHSAELITHLVHYDVLGTQTYKDKANCLGVIQHYLQSFMVETNANLAKDKLSFNLNIMGKHNLILKAYPIGINVAKIQQQVAELKATSLSSSLGLPSKDVKKQSIKTTQQQIIAVDRIDYSKGILQRLSAYRNFLQQNPAYQQQLRFLQIACPSRMDLSNYQQLYAQVRAKVNSLNVEFSSLKANSDFAADKDLTALKNNSVDYPNIWQPITYTEKALDHERLMQAFWRSDVCWVNSLKDGMNLVAKEYIAAQNPENPGVLLLSRYAGASEQMPEAVIIDPYHPSSMLKGIEQALTMSLTERKERHHSLLQGLKQQNIHSWQRDFLKDVYQ